MTWYQKFKESVFFRRLFFLAFVTSLILFRTLLNRQLWMNPLSDVMGGWGIWETVNGEQQLTTECIENVIMMMPFSAVVMWTFGEKIGNSWKKILWQSGKIQNLHTLNCKHSETFQSLRHLVPAISERCVLPKHSRKREDQCRSRAAAEIQSNEAVEG